jgi:hypothetical protein
VREVRAYPVALVVKDMRQAETRVATIEQALDRPGREGIEALFALFSRRRARVSTAESTAVEAPAH